MKLMLKHEGGTGFNCVCGVEGVASGMHQKKPFHPPSLGCNKALAWELQQGISQSQDGYGACMSTHGTVLTS